MTKMTYVDALNVAIDAVSADPEVFEKLTALKAQIEKRNSSERKPSKTQRENEEIKKGILEYLASATERKTATEVASALGISNQKASALLTSLVKGGFAERVVDKRKAYFEGVA